MSINEEPVTLTVGRAEALVLFEMLSRVPHRSDLYESTGAPFFARAVCEGWEGECLVLDHPRDASRPCQPPRVIAFASARDS
jgi:hypothetical protein